MQAAESLRSRLSMRSSGMSFERITVDPTQMAGVPCIRGLRITVSMVLGQLAAGRSSEQLLEDYPYLEREDVTAARSNSATGTWRLNFATSPEMLEEAVLRLAGPSGTSAPGGDGRPPRLPAFGTVPPARLR